MLNKKKRNFQIFSSDNHEKKILGKFFFKQYSNFELLTKFLALFWLKSRKIKKIDSKNVSLM